MPDLSGRRVSDNAFVVSSTKDLVSAFTCALFALLKVLRNVPISRAIYHPSFVKSLLLCDDIAIFWWPPSPPAPNATGSIPYISHSVWLLNVILVSYAWNDFCVCLWPLFFHICPDRPSMLAKTAAKYFFVNSCAVATTADGCLAYSNLNSGIDVKSVSDSCVLF